MDLYYLLIIVATLVGFCGLAWLLLAPIWRFLDREEEVSREWTREALARRRREQQRSGNASGSADGAPPGGDGAAAPSPGDRERRPPPDARG